MVCGTGSMWIRLLVGCILWKRMGVLWNSVGGACNRNPIMIVVPCHRVIGGNGKLVGFGGGLAMKEKLLELEGISVRN